MSGPGPLAPVALTMGEPAGVGAEITLLAWLARAGGVPTFFAIDDADRLGAMARALAWPVPVRPITAPEDAAAVFESALPVLHRPLARPAVPGRPQVDHAPAVIGAIDAAVALALSGQASAVVTNPIHKKVLLDAGFPFAGHTEYLAERAGAGSVPVMMLVCPHLRVVPVTVHVSLRRAIDTLTTDAIVAAGRIAARALSDDFGIAEPRIAVAGLNPHGGEGGTMGGEDAAIVAPAVAALRALGIDARGPLPPDTLFAARTRPTYDLALCMYHDQALIPLKTLDFDGGVNVTAGLPFVRTSPDHGTALDLAGTGTASPSSLIAALRLAAAIAERRATGG